MVQGSNAQIRFCLAISAQAPARLPLQTRLRVCGHAEILLVRSAISESGMSCWKVLCQGAQASLKLVLAASVLAGVQRGARS